MSRRTDDPLLDARIRVDNIPSDGREIEVEADAEQRSAIAEQLGISAVEKLTAKLMLSRFRGGLRVLGQLQAIAVQPCVVTFVPVEQTIDEPIDRVFLPAGEQAKPQAGNKEVFVDLEGDDLPDYFEGHEVDLSTALVETLALALDPYPRAPGAGLADIGLPPDELEESPFAGLKSLLDPDGKG